MSSCQRKLPEQPQIVVTQRFVCLRRSCKSRANACLGLLAVKFEFESDVDKSIYIGRGRGQLKPKSCTRSSSEINGIERATLLRTGIELKGALRRKGFTTNHPNPPKEYVVLDTLVWRTAAAGLAETLSTAACQAAASAKRLPATKSREAKKKSWRCRFRRLLARRQRRVPRRDELPNGRSASKVLTACLEGTHPRAGLYRVYPHNPVGDDLITLGMGSGYDSVCAFKLLSTKRSTASSCAI